MRRIFLSPAKVNLLLKILGRRADGYHEILSIVDLISLYDIIAVEPKEKGEIVLRCLEGEMPNPEENLIYKAVTLFKENFGVKEGVAVYVRKRIPVGSGLGGASSNAATILRALTEIWNLKVSEQKLYDLGIKLGADVPLFLYGRPSILRGIGEVIEPIEIPRIWYVIVYPGISISTRDVYSNAKVPLKKNENEFGINRNFEKIEDIAKIMENDLEESAKRFLPDLEYIKQTLKNCGAYASLMTGSGSCVYGCFGTKRDAMEAKRKLASYPKVFVAKSRRRVNERRKEA